MVTDQQRDLIDRFFTNIVNGYTNEDIENFINDEENKAVIDNFTLTSKEIDDAVLNCHIKLCEGVTPGVGVSPYTLVSPDFSINNLERQVLTIAPKFVDVIRNIDRRYVDFSVMFNTLRQSLQNLTVERIVDSVRKEATNKAIEYAKEVVKEEVQEKVKKVAKEAANDAAEQAKNDASAASKSAKEAADSAANAAKNANDAVIRAVDKEKPNLAKTAAETTVTVLSIFAAIVVTIIAGLVFSNSVFQNMNDASVFRLALTTSLVGIICLNMIVYMIRYISKIGVTDELLPAWKNVWGKHDRIVIGVDIFLGVLVTVSFILTCIFDFNPKDSNGISSDSNDNISVNVAVEGNKSSLQSSDIPSEEVTGISTAVDTPTDSVSESYNSARTDSYDNPDTGDECN